MEQTTERELLKAIYEVKEDVARLETKIDDSVAGRFKEHERRIEKLEQNQRWVVLAIIGMILEAIMSLILK